MTDITEEWAAFRTRIEEARAQAVNGDESTYVDLDQWEADILH